MVGCCSQSCRRYLHALLKACGSRLVARPGITTHFYRHHPHAHLLAMSLTKINNLVQRMQLSQTNIILLTLYSFAMYKYFVLTHSPINVLFFKVPLIKERVTLSSLKSDMWTAEHDATILRFLKDSTLRLLVVYVDKLLGLQVALSVPPHPVEEMTYMIRFEDAMLNPDNIEQKLQFGTIRANHIESLLRTMTNVYAPLFFGNRSWPDSILAK